MARSPFQRPAEDADPAREPSAAEPDAALLEGRRIARARAGERAAQEELLRAHYPRLYATAFRLAGNPEDAEDLAQDCLVKGLGALTFYRGEGSFAGWLRRILVHLAQDRFRARGRRSAARFASAERVEFASLAGGREPHGELEGRELARLLADALETLAPALRAALLMRTREGLEYEELAELTGVTPETARTRVMKARKELARLLAPHLDAYASRSTPRRAP
jgi:RNA polymerase sigma-70 factor (ECF subfamily)